ADPAAGGLVGRTGGTLDALGVGFAQVRAGRRRVRGGGFQETADPVMLAQQRLDLPPQRRVVAALLPQQLLPLRGTGLLRRREEDLLDPFQVGWHGVSSRSDLHLSKRHRRAGSLRENQTTASGGRFVAAQFAQQPGAGERPVPVGGGARQAEALGGLVHRQA